MGTSVIAGRLGDPEGFAGVMKGMFKGGKATKAHAIYHAAERKGVYETVELRFVTHEGTGYAVMAFSTTGPIELPAREAMARQAESFPLGVVRYEAFDYSSMRPIGWDSAKLSDNSISTIAEPFPGVVAYTACVSKTGSNQPLVIHANKAGKDYIYPIPGELLR